MNKELTAKTGSVERLITHDADIQLVLNGVKTTTRRNGRFADPGEILTLKGQSFEVYNVYQQQLGDITDADAKSEGFKDFEAYKQYILSMHQGMPWIPTATVWVHEFRPLPEK